VYWKAAILNTLTHPAVQTCPARTRLESAQFSHLPRASSSGQYYLRVVSLESESPLYQLSPVTMEQGLQSRSHSTV